MAPAPLAACPACDGLLPTSNRLTRCLHCDVALTTRWGWLRPLLTAATAGLASVTLMACYGGPMVWDDCVDQDGDGWFPACYDQPCDPQVDPFCDCDDTDPRTHPGAPDPVGDGRDTDCSGEDGPAKCGDGPCPDAMTWPDASPAPDAADAPDADPAPDTAEPEEDAAEPEEDAAAAPEADAPPR